MLMKRIMIIMVIFSAKHSWECMLAINTFSHPPDVGEKEGVNFTFVNFELFFFWKGV